MSSSRWHGATMDPRMAPWSFHKGGKPISRLGPVVSKHLKLGPRDFSWTNWHNIKPTGSWTDHYNTRLARITLSTMFCTSPFSQSFGPSYQSMDALLSYSPWRLKCPLPPYYKDLLPFEEISLVGWMPFQHQFRQTSYAIRNLSQPIAQAHLMWW